MRRHWERKIPYSFSEMARRERGRRLPDLMPPEEVRTLGDRTVYSQGWIVRRLRGAWETRNDRQYPYDGMHREARRAGLAHCEVHYDPPRWVDVWEQIKKPRVVKDKWGRVLFMDKGIKAKKRIRPEDFSPVTQFEPLYTIHPDPANATQEEKDKRVSAYLHAYSLTGIISSSAAYVGVSYFYLLIWINESEERQAQLRVAQEAAKLIMVDVGRQRAMAGDSAMMRFFIERENPELYGRKSSAGNLPDGVTEESVVSALAVIQRAQQAADEKERGEVKQFPTLVDQKRENVAALIEGLVLPQGN